MSESSSAALNSKNIIKTEDKTMTREEKLYSMRMMDLLEVAAKLNIKIDKKGAKSKAITKILEAESQMSISDIPVKDAEELEDTSANINVVKPEEDAEECREEKKERKARKKKETSEDVHKLLDDIINQWMEIGGTIKQSNNNSKYMALCAGEKSRQIIKVMWSCGKVWLLVRIPEVKEIAINWREIKYSLPYVCEYNEYTWEVMDNIREIMNIAVDLDSVRKSRKNTKCA